SPCAVRSSRSRRRTRASTLSVGTDGFAGMANQLATRDGVRHAGAMSSEQDGTWDCVVVGGGAAGLSAALVLGRARQRTLVVDDGRQSNRSAHGVGGLLGHDGRPPSELYANARAELAQYPAVTVREGTVAGGA